MREKHGWVTLKSETVLLGLDSYQFHLYHLARALATPPNAQKNPGLLDLPDSQIATLMKCSRFTIYRVKKELLGMGLLSKQEGQWYVTEPSMAPLHNHAMALQEIRRFLQENEGIAAALNPVPRRTGQRKGHRSGPTPVAPVDSVAPVDTPVAPVDTPVAPVDTPVAPVDTSPICTDHIRVQVKKSTRGGTAPPSRVGGTVVPSSFEAWKGRLTPGKNPVPVLVDAFRILHSGAPPEDLAGLGGRLAGMVRDHPGDQGYILKLIWGTSSVPIAGSHLNYIQKALKGELNDGRRGTRGTWNAAKEYTEDVPAGAPPGA